MLYACLDRNKAGLKTMQPAKKKEQPKLSTLSAPQPFHSAVQAVRCAPRSPPALPSREPHHPKIKIEPVCYIVCTSHLFDIFSRFKTRNLTSTYASPPPSDTERSQLPLDHALQPR